jgi:hypothetical protein
MHMLQTQTFKRHYAPEYWRQPCKQSILLNAKGHTQQCTQAALNHINHENYLDHRLANRLRTCVHADISTLNDSHRYKLPTSSTSNLSIHQNMIQSYPSRQQSIPASSQSPNDLRSSGVQPGTFGTCFAWNHLHYRWSENSERNKSLKERFVLAIL